MIRRMPWRRHHPHQIIQHEVAGHHLSASRFDDRQHAVHEVRRQLRARLVIADAGVDQDVWCGACTSQDCTQMISLPVALCALSFQPGAVLLQCLLCQPGKNPSGSKSRPA
jgi:hypothetical protein